MKKSLSVFSILAILCLASPAFAAPPGAMGPMGHPAGQPVQAHVVRAGYRQPAPPPPPMMHRPNAGMFVGGALARRGCWGYPYRCDYRLGYYYDGFYYRTYPCYNNGLSINLRF